MKAEVLTAGAHLINHIAKLFDVGTREIVTVNYELKVTQTSSDLSSNRAGPADLQSLAVSRSNEVIIVPIEGPLAELTDSHGQGPPAQKGIVHSSGASGSVTSRQRFLIVG